jgi:hypothetical protein
MFKKLAFLLLILTHSIFAAAQTDSSHLRISLLTCGPGDNEVYEVFGHTAIRVIDSIELTDNVYNYGTFSYGPDFEIKFMRGKLLYALGVEPYHYFLQEYVEAKRSVEEQVLLFTGPQKEQVYSFLEWNALPEHKNYKYDFFFDNCATRIRDVFPKTLDPGFAFGNAIPKDSKLTFRDIINEYFFQRHWERVGVNILLGSKIDKVMSNADIMFLPDYLRDGVSAAAVNGRPVSSPPKLILPGGTTLQKSTNLPFLLTSLLALLTILGLTVPKLRLLGRIMSTFLLLTSGLLGCLILVMWFATDHQACADNFNILWLLPTNFIIAFSNPKGKGRYALIAIALIVISIILHLLGIQKLVIEFIPLMLALVFIYGTIYRRTKAAQNTHYA